MIRLLETRLDKVNKTPYLYEWDAMDYPIKIFDNPSDIAQMLEDSVNISWYTTERVYQLCLDTKSNLIGLFEVSRGTVDGSICDVFTICQNAFMCNAKRIVVAHNHPSGNPTLSEYDKNVCNKITKACNVMGVELLDFIVCAGEKYNSYLEVCENENGMVD